MEMIKSAVKLRSKSNKQNENVYKDEKQEEEFVLRESPLTLLGSSLHFRAIYHIFIVILLGLLCDTLIFDFIDHGKIDLGLSIVVQSFGGIKLGFHLWLYEQTVAFAFYPLLLIYAWLGKFSIKYTMLRPAMILLGIVGVTATQLALTAIPIYELSRKRLALASSGAVACEMFRLMMKIIAVAATCGPRCLNGTPALPSLQHYAYFLFAPTLLYRDHYPRTKNIRWDKIILYFLEIGTIILFCAILAERFILPYWWNYGKQNKLFLIPAVVTYSTMNMLTGAVNKLYFDCSFYCNWYYLPISYHHYKVEVGRIVRAVFACTIPSVIFFVCAFYCLFHAWLNAWAELLTFGDRLFYEDWWTTSRFSLYYRRWNLVVYSWLRDYIYYPLTPSLGRPLSTFIVFFVSSVAHEIIVTLSLGFFYPVLLIEFGVLGLLLVPLTVTYGQRYPNAFNLFLWLGLFIGNGLLCCLYLMEYFARQNCPPAESDSFFIPKSWSCPEVILKPDWRFLNALPI